MRFVLLRHLAWLALACAPACAGAVDAGVDPADESDSPADTTYSAAGVPTGAQAKVTATSLNLRSGPSTTYNILAVMKNGDVVTALGQSGGWNKVDFNGITGWCSSTYLQTISSSGGGGAGDDGGTSSSGGSGPVDDAMARAQSGVGFSYHWGDGCWSTGGNPGSCLGSCPNCSHSGQWGADCSGYVAKVWQVPGKSDITECAHPYSTAEFYNSHDHWSDVSRADVQRGDAFVYRSGSSGHIFLYDSGDAWGNVIAYECKGCSYGCVKDNRVASSAYKPIRREGF
ncbi:MAG TPA: SH3 domain-containing protein [Polyangia bacterium]|nr:SH3 domain-containing protein [Polyangia bacterium]